MTSARPKDLELLRKAYEAVGDRMDPDEDGYDPEEATYSAINAVRLNKTKNRNEAGRRLHIAASAIAARMAGVSVDPVDANLDYPGGFDGVSPRSVSGQRLALIISAFATKAIFDAEDATGLDLPFPEWARAL